MEALQTIKEPVLRELIQASEAVSATVSGRERGFAIVVHLGNSDKLLATSRGVLRLFASLDTACSFVKDLGLERFEVDMSGYLPGRLEALDLIELKRFAIPEPRCNNKIWSSAHDQ